MRWNTDILGRLVIFVYTWILLHHMLGGIRHLVWDFGHGMEPDRDQEGAGIERHAGDAVEHRHRHGPGPAVDLEALRAGGGPGREAQFRAATASSGRDKERMMAEPARSPGAPRR
jgi:hypothetical protein